MGKTPSTAAGAAFAGAFPRVRVINLAQRADRRREMEAEFAKLGLAFGDGIRLHVATRCDDAAGFPTIGTRGCFLSHLGVLEAALADDAESVLIVEDDLSFSPSEIARMADSLAALKTQAWSIFYGGILRYGDQEQPTGVASPLFVADPATGIMGGHFLAMRRDAIAAAVPYLQAILTRPPGSPEGGPMHVDGAYGWLRAARPDLVTLVANPGLGHQRASRTDIHQLRWKDRVPVVRDVVQWLRQARRA